MTTCANTSDPLDPQGDPNNLIGRVGAAFIVIIIVMGSIGNILVILVIVLKKKLQVSYNAFIVGLALCDVLFTTSTMPFYVSSYMHRRWLFSDALCRIHTFMGAVLASAAAMHIGCIALNRYFLLVHHNKYHILGSRLMVTIKMVIIWTLSGLIVLPSIAGWDAEIKFTDQIGRCNYVRSKSRLTLYLVFIVGFIVPCIVMIVCYVRIMQTLKSNKKRISVYSVSQAQNEGSNTADYSPQLSEHRPHEYAAIKYKSIDLGVLSIQDQGHMTLPNDLQEVYFQQDQNGGNVSYTQNGYLAPPPMHDTKRSASVDWVNLNSDTESIRIPQTNNSFRKEKRTLKMIMMVFVGFCISYFPFTIVNLTDERGCYPRAVYMVTAVFFWSGSCVNPWIYGIMNSHFREAYRDVLCSCLKKYKCFHFNIN